MHVSFHYQAIIINEDGKMLVLNNRHTDNWEMPGGDSSPPELHSVALRRIVKEQIGIEIWEFQVVGVDTVYEAETDTYHVFIGFMAELTVLTLLRLHAVYSEYRWLSLEDFRKLNMPLNLLEFVIRVAHAHMRKIKNGAGFLHILD